MNQTPAEPTTLESLDRRISHIERLLIEIHATQAPRWLRSGGWMTVIAYIIQQVVEK